MTPPPTRAEHPEAAEHRETPDAVVTRGPFAARANLRVSARVGEAWGYIVAALIILICTALGAAFAQLARQLMGATP